MSFDVAAGTCSEQVTPERRQSEQGGSHSAFYDPVLEVRQHHLYVLELEPTLRGRGIRFYFLKGGASENLWAYFKTATQPKTATAHQLLCASCYAGHKAAS